MLMIVVSVTAAAVVIHAVVRRFLPFDTLREHHDVAAAVYAMLGILHSLIFGYLVVTGQERLDASKQAVTREAAILLDLRHSSRALSEPHATIIFDKTKAYANDVITTSWTSMSAGAAHDVRPGPFRELWSAVLRVPLDSERDKVIAQSMLASLNDLSQAREGRLHLSSERLGPLMSAILYLGAASLIMGLLLFAHRSASIQLVMTALVAVTVSMIISLIFALDAPVASGMLTPEAFDDLLRRYSPPS